MTKITRRTALAAGIATGAASCASAPKMTPYTASAVRAVGVFAHGVASGDPQTDSVVIWTRISIPLGMDVGAAVTVVWETASDAGFTNLVGKGEATAAASADWTVKTILTDLQPGTDYYYRFRFADTDSPTGRTRTLPTGAVENASFAVISCSNYPFGYFNVYDLIARQENIDAVIHLGDYLYEYGPDGYGGESGAKLGRPHDPPREIITLDDYRKRHAQYKSDPSSQAMHAKHPLIMIWDDHETTNDSWKGGAENHDSATEGDWNDRRRAALQAYYEWMPVREPEPGLTREALFRSYSFGDLLTITALETRLMARSKQINLNEVAPTLQTPEDLERFNRDILWDQSRELLGATQTDFVDRSLRDSVAAGQPWRLIANQIIMAKVIAPDLTPHVEEEDIVALEQQWDQARAFIGLSKLGLPSNLDAWDGYPAARERFYETAKNADADGLIVLTGDTHSWWANDLMTEDEEPMGVELGVHSVTSPSPYHSSFLGGKGADYALLTNRDNKAVRYLSGENHGFIALNVSHDEVKATYMAVDTVETPAYNAFEKVSFDIGKSKDGVKFTGKDGLGFKEGFLF